MTLGYSLDSYDFRLVAKQLWLLVRGERKMTYMISNWTQTTKQHKAMDEEIFDEVKTQFYC